MSDKVVVMNNGEIQQIGSPTDIYNEPENRFVAEFIGESNILEGKMIEDYRVFFDGKEHVCVDYGFGEDEDVDIVIRPEDIDILPKGEGVYDGLITSLLFKGVHYEYVVKTEYRDYIVHNTDLYGVGSEISINFGPEDIHVMWTLEAY